MGKYVFGGEWQLPGNAQTTAAVSEGPDAERYGEELKVEYRIGTLDRFVETFATCRHHPLSKPVFFIFNTCTGSANGSHWLLGVVANNTVRENGISPSRASNVVGPVQGTSNLLNQAAILARYHVWCLGICNNHIIPGITTDVLLSMQSWAR